MVQSADTRQWEQQVRIPVVPTADLTKSSTQSGAGFINCTFYDVEDSFGKRTFVNKRPGFQFTLHYLSLVGLEKKTSYGLYLDTTSSQSIGSGGGYAQTSSVSYVTPITNMSYQSFDIGIVRNGSVELKGGFVKRGHPLQHTNGVSLSLEMIFLWYVYRQNMEELCK